MSFPILSRDELEGVSRALADTEFGFTGIQLGQMIQQYGFVDTDPNMTKYKRLFNSFTERINREHSYNSIYFFIQKSMDPAIEIREPEKYRRRMYEVNKILMLKGIEINDAGQFVKTIKAETASEVERRTRDLRKKLLGYGVHSKILECCREELLDEDYFHAVQEAAKSICERLRQMSGLSMDGTELIQTVMSIKKPYIALNSLRTETEKNLQNGLKELMLSIIHMVRNVTAHELRIRWDINESDAAEILSLISYVHKCLDICVTVSPNIY